MIFVSHALPVNQDGQPRLDRAAVWNGLVLKADNALPFVPAMTRCDIVERYGPTSFDRDIEFRGQQFRERVTLEEPNRVVFTRISGPVLGTISNEIQLRPRGRWRAGRLAGRARVRRGDDIGLPQGRRRHAGRDAPHRPRRSRLTSRGGAMSTWIDDYYADVDAMRLEPFVERHSDDASVVFGNNPPAVGKEAIGAAIGGFWSMIGGLRHERRNLWFVNDGDTAVLEVVTHYTTKGGAKVPVPCVSLLDRNADGKVTSLRVYIDLAPLFERIGAEQAERPETVTA